MEGIGIVFPIKEKRQAENTKGRDLKSLPSGSCVGLGLTDGYA